MLKSPSGSEGKASACNAGDLGSILSWEDPLEKEMATHSSILAWKIPWTEKLVGYSPWGHKESDTTEQLHFHSHFTFKPKLTNKVNLFKTVGNCPRKAAP